MMTESADLAKLEGAPVPGDILAGKYRVERIVGVGGMGVVLAARHLELDETVAIKFLLPSFPRHGENIARFVGEARAAIKIRSENVVRIFDVTRLPDGTPFIVMELLEGCDLAQLLREGPLSVADAVEYVRQTCDAVAAAHAVGIIHRDLKPANLFRTVRSDGSYCVKVLDFGISKMTQRGRQGAGLTSSSTIMGTASFMSPEQLRSTRDVDPRADVWSLGAILHALLTGSPPFDGESQADVSARILRDPTPPLSEARPDVPRGVEEVVRRCLEKDASRRFASATELAEALRGLASDLGPPTVMASGRPLTSHPPPIATPPGFLSPALGSDSAVTRTASAWGDSTPAYRPKAHRRWAIGVAAGTLVLAAGAAGIWGIRGPRARNDAADDKSVAQSAATRAQGWVEPASAAPPAIPGDSLPTTSAAAIPSPISGAPASAAGAPVAAKSAPARLAPSAKPKPRKKELFDDRE